MSSPDQKITETTGSNFNIPEAVQVGDFIVARYTESQWSRYLPWEEWDHVAIISQLNPLKVIEVSGIILQKADKKNKKAEIREGVVEYEFKKPRTATLLNGTKNKNGNLWLLDDLIEINWLKPVFPDPIREIDKWYVRRSKRKIITEQEARVRAVTYAKNQLNEPYNILASKWSESGWYCSLLIYKSYSRTVTDMYLESYGSSSDLIAGPMVTPEDLVDSPRSKMYYVWKKKK